jgi:signal transduction histidine kinase
MALTANSLEKTLTAEARSESAAARKICRLLDEAITESRRVCRGLYPVRLETEGLVAALEELAQTASQRYKIRCEFETDSRQFQCDVTTATHLYRIAQEAVNNAIKHSGGRNIMIRFSGSGDEIELDVKDDGAGIKDRPERRGGMGLHIMDYRANRIGGILRISAQDGGTMVTCRVPRRMRETEAPATEGPEG